MLSLVSVDLLESEPLGLLLSLLFAAVAPVFGFTRVHLDTPHVTFVAAKLEVDIASTDDSELEGATVLFGSGIDGLVYLIAIST